MSGKLDIKKPAVSYIDLNQPSETIKYVLGLCAIIFVSAVLFFSYLRPKFRQIYAPRILLIENKIDTVVGASSTSYFSWILSVWKVSDEDIYTFSGLDALMFLRFMRLALSLAVVTLPYGMIVLLPINIYGKNHLNDTLDMLSMSNVENSSSHLWAHWVAIWIYSIVIFYLTYKEWKVYICYRQKHLLQGFGCHFAVFVQNLPKHAMDNASLTEVLTNLFPDKISGVYVVEDLSVWDKLIKKHDRYVENWEKAKFYLEMQNKRLTVGKHPCSEKQDAITMYEMELEIIQKGLLQDKMAEKKVYPCAFVFFKSLKAQSEALQVIWNSDPLEYDVSAAPNPSEVIWSNLLYPKYARNIRKTIGFIAVFFLVIFWAAPITFISSSLVHLPSVFKKLQCLNMLPGSDFVLGLIQGVLPVLLLALFYLALPYILFAIAQFQRKISKSSQAMMVFKCLFVFQTFNTFFVYIMSGSILQNLTRITARPFELPNLLAASLPSQAGFFINYFALVSMVGLAVELTRIAPLCITFLKLKWFAKTNREKLQAWRPRRPEYEVMFSQALLFFLIGLSFSILSPIIIPLFVMYFAFGYCVWLYQLLHVYIPEYDNGGQFWPEVFYRIMVCVTVFQMIMFGVFLLKLKWFTAGITFPLIPITFVFWWVMANKYKKCSQFLSLSTAGVAENAERNFLEDVRQKYIRNSNVPEIFEMSSSKYTDIYESQSRSLNHADGNDDDGDEDDDDMTNELSRFVI